MIKEDQLREIYNAFQREQTERERKIIAAMLRDVFLILDEDRGEVINASRGWSSHLNTGKLTVLTEVADTIGALPEGPVAIASYGGSITEKGILYETSIPLDQLIQTLDQDNEHIRRDHLESIIYGLETKVWLPANRVVQIVPRVVNVPLLWP